MKIFNEKNRVQWIVAAVALAAFVFAVYSYKLYQWGVSSAETAAAASYSEAEKAFAEKQKVFEQEKADFAVKANQAILAEKKTAEENKLLKQAAAINAQIMRESDDRRRIESAAKLNQIIEEKKSEIQKIQSDTDFDSNVCALCSEFNGTITESNPAGLRLSVEFCARCRAQP